MIIQEILELNNIQLKHTFSSDHKYIKQLETGVIYDETYDLAELNYTYEETEDTIEEDLIQDLQSFKLKNFG